MKYHFMTYSQNILYITPIYDSHRPLLILKEIFILYSQLVYNSLKINLDYKYSYSLNEENIHL